MEDGRILKYMGQYPADEVREQLEQPGCPLEYVLEVDGHGHGILTELDKTEVWRVM